MTWPTLRAQVAFDTDPLETPSWTTIHEGTTTQRATSATVRTGRAFELDPFQPGRMTLRLDNSDRRFDPLHASGPYFGKLLPRKRTRLQADWGAYLNLTGASTSGAFTPDAAALDITGDLDLRCRVSGDWTPAADSTLVAKGNLLGQFSYLLALLTTGGLRMAWSTAGTLGSILITDSTAAVGAADGEIRWVRATLDVDAGGGNRAVRFYTSSDDTHDHTAVSWTQLGSTVTTAGTTSVFSGSAGASVGILADGSAPFTGRIYAAAILSGIGGTVVADPDFTDGNRFAAGATSGTDAAGRTWTVSSPATLVPVTYDLFSGFVDTWPQDFGRFQATAQMTATDAFKILSKVDMASAHEETVRADAPVGWWRLGDDTPTSSLCSDSSGYGHDGVYRGVPAGVDSIVDGAEGGAVDLDGVNDKADLPPEAFATPLATNTGTYSIELWFQTTMVGTAAPGGVMLAGSTYDQSVGLFDHVGMYITTTGAVRFRSHVNSTTLDLISTSILNDGRPHHVVGVLDTDKKRRLYVDGALEATAASAVAALTFTGPDRLRLGAGRINVAGDKYDGILDEVAIYNSALTADQVAAHYNAGHTPWAGDTTGARIGRALTLAGWPTADRDIDTGRSTMGPYQGADSNILAIAQEAETTEGGALWQAPDGRVTFRDRHAPIQDWNATVSQATFTDDGTATNPQHYTTLDLAYDDTLIVNEAEVTWSDGVETARDQTSIDTYTRQAIQITTALATAPEARDRGDWLLQRYKDPSVRPERVALRPAADPRLWRHCLARKIGDRVTVRRKPQNTGTPIEFDAAIESISHRITDGKNTWETEFGLSPTAVDLGWLILDDTTDGLVDTGRLAF